MGDSALQHGDADEVFLGIVDALLDGGLNLLGFTKAVTYNTVFISNNDDGSKGESSTTFGNLGDAIDSDETVFELYLA